MCKSLDHVLYMIFLHWQAIKAYYWKDSGEDALTFQYRTFTCQEKDGAHVYLSAPTLTEAAPGVGWQCSVLQKKVYM